MSRLRAGGHACVSLLITEMRKMSHPRQIRTAVGLRKAVMALPFFKWKREAACANPRVLRSAGGFFHLLLKVLGGGVKHPPAARPQCTLETTLLGLKSR